jgi:nitrate reductase NapAB chaperone NapD
MIASVVVTLDKHSGHLQDVIDEIATIRFVEVGNAGDCTHRLPLIIDAPDPESLEEVTRELQRCRGVAFVDVVFVHFEQESSITLLTGSETTTSI